MNSLKNYHGIVSGKFKANYLLCKKIFLEADDSEEELWKAHEEGMRKFYERSKTEEKGKTLLDIKEQLAKKILEKCRLCERRCEVNRTEGKKGICGVLESRVASEFLHWGEEPELIPSHTIFFSGCVFKCVFCQNWDISQAPDVGKCVEPRKLSEIIVEKCGRNVNWVGGDPIPNLHYIISVLNLCNANLPQVWNSNMYCSLETMKLLDGIIDLYLADFKYGNDDCAFRLSKVKNYFSIVSRNHKIANKQCEMIIRHLVLPGHINCCTIPILDWIAKELDNSKVRVNVMDQYHPDYKVLRSPSEYPGLARALSTKEFLEAYKYGKAKGLDLI
ncbi:MAG: radical SAM protein [Candidatus Thermoplasmatota archaeon]